MKSYRPLLAEHEKEKIYNLHILPSIERHCSPLVRVPPNNSRESQSEKLLLPSIHISKVSSRSSSRSSNTKSSSSQYGSVYGYAVQSHQGISRHKIEDRVSIVNLPKPSTFQDSWPRSTFFGLYNGHAGSTCSNYLKNHLHNNILAQQAFPSHIKQALFSGFLKTDQSFLTEALEKGDMSGSCAIVALIIANNCFVAGTGHSQAVISYQKGSKIKSLIRPHVLEEPKELERVLKAGGSISTEYFLNDQHKKVPTGSARVNPGRLQVCRAFGNLDAKEVKYGGNPLVVIAEPEIKSFKITHLFDFLLLGTNSLFEQFNEKKIVKFVWESLDNTQDEELSTRLVAAVDNLIDKVEQKGSLKNISCILIAFKNITEEADV